MGLELASVVAYGRGVEVDGFALGDFRLVCAFLLVLDGVGRDGVAGRRLVRCFLVDDFGFAGRVIDDLFVKRLGLNVERGGEVHIFLGRHARRIKYVNDRSSASHL